MKPAFPILAVVFFLTSAAGVAQNAANTPEPIVIRPADQTNRAVTLTVVRPPDRYRTGAAVVIAPGGAYVGLATELEGSEPAHWFAARGIMAFVLRYRVGETARLPAPIQDGTRAIRWVRAHADEYGIDRQRIGLMGFSAGGHLAASVATGTGSGSENPELRVSARPDFLILAYPWLEGTVPDRKGRSPYCDFALKRSAKPCDPRAYARFQPIEAVSASTPPTFLYHTTADELVPVEGSLRFYAAMRHAGVPAELHVFENGSHGTGLGAADPALSRWPDLLQEWLRGRGLLERRVTAPAN